MTFVDIDKYKLDAIWVRAHELDLDIDKYDEVPTYVVDTWSLNGVQMCCKVYTYDDLKQLVVIP